MLTRLKSAFDYIRVYTDLLPFTSYLVKEKLVANVVVIISSVLHTSSMRELVLQQAHIGENKFIGPYILLFGQTNTPSEYPVFTNIDQLFVEIDKDIEHHPQQPVFIQSKVTTSQPVDESKYSDLFPPVGIMNTVIKKNPIIHLSNESLRFVQFQALIEILFAMQHDERSAKDDMLFDCREHYQKNPTQLRKIKDFNDNYTAANVISYYTEDGFCFRMVNAAFHSEDIERIFRYRLFITDLHKQLTQRANERQEMDENIVIYRGKRLLNTILQKLKDSIQKLISFNGFLSTTKNESAAKAFSGDEETHNNHSSVIFELHISNLRNYKGKPFVDISTDIENDNMDAEQEVLFSVGTVWRVVGVERKDHLWRIKLTSYADFDKDLRDLLASLSDGYTLLSVGKLLEELGEDVKAENFYRQMLENEQSIADEQRGILHFRIGLLREKKDDHFGALDALNKAIPYCARPVVASETLSSSTRSIPSLNIPSRLASYFTIGMIHYRNKSLREAQRAWEHALKEEGPSDIVARVYDGLAQLASGYGDHEKATKYYKEALESINNSSVNEELEGQLKRKFDEATHLSNEMNKVSRPKRQRTEDVGETVN